MRRGHGSRASVRLHNDPDCAFAHPTGALSDEMMRIRSPKDFWAGLIFIAIGGGFVLLAQQYRLRGIHRLGAAMFPTLVGGCVVLLAHQSRLGDMHRMGPAMFPTLVGALLAALGVVVALRSFALDGAPVPRFEARPIGVSILAIVLFGIALQWLGLIAAVAVLVLVGAYAARDVPPLENLPLAAARGALP